MKTVLRFLERRATLVVTTLALVIRVLQDLVFQPPMSRAHLYSDMGAYVSRARQMFDHPDAKVPASTFFPYGTHFLVYGVERVFGRDDSWAVNLTFALIGTLAVLYSYLAARQLFRERPRIALVVGLILATYVPWIRQGSFVLSEIPLACAIAATSYYSLRLAELGRARDAALLGVFFAIGATFRPQLLASAVLLLVVVFLCRRSVRARYWTAGVAALPIALVLAGSAWRTHYHTDRYGFIATNGGFNFAAGRCHPITLQAKGQSYRATYSPPPFNALDEYESRHGMKPLLTLDPAFGKRLVYEGDGWDSAPALAQAEKCMEKTGVLKQAKYSLTHLMLLWLYNGPWPDSGGVVTVVFAAINLVLFTPAMFLGWVLAFRRRDASLPDPAVGVLLLSAHVAALFVTAMLVFGEARLRLPYDGVILTMAAYGYAVLWPWARARVGRRSKISTRSSARMGKESV